MANKYIICKAGDNTEIKFGVVDYHYELHKEPNSILSGGYWFLNKSGNYILFYSDSHDFGQPTIEEFKTAISKSNSFNRFKNFKIYFSTYKSIDRACETKELITIVE